MCRFCRLNVFWDGNMGNFKWNFKITFWGENSLVKKDIKISATYLKCIFGWVTWDSSSQRFCDTKKVCWSKSTSCWERKWNNRRYIYKTTTKIKRIIMKNKWQNIWGITLERKRKRNLRNDNCEEKILIYKIECLDGTVKV